jgi:hypothetical protein
MRHGIACRRRAETYDTHGTVHANSHAQECFLTMELDHLYARRAAVENLIRSIESYNMSIGSTTASLTHGASPVEAIDATPVVSSRSDFARLRI